MGEAAACSSRRGPLAAAEACAVPWGLGGGRGDWGWGGQGGQGAGWGAAGRWEGRLLCCAAAGWLVVLNCLEGQVLCTGPNHPAAPPPPCPKAAAAPLAPKTQAPPTCNEHQQHRRGEDNVDALHCEGFEGRWGGVGARRSVVFASGSQHEREKCGMSARVPRFIVVEGSWKTEQHRSCAAAPQLCSSASAQLPPSLLPAAVLLLSAATACPAFSQLHTAAHFTHNLSRKQRHTPARQLARLLACNPAAQQPNRPTIHQPTHRPACLQLVPPSKGAQTCAGSCRARAQSRPPLG